MKRKAYKCFLAAVLLFTGINSYAVQTEPLPPVPPARMTDTLSHTDFPKLRVKMDKLNKLNWHKQTLAMNSNMEKLQSKMKEFGNHISTEVTNSFSYRNSEQVNSDDDYKVVKQKSYSKSYSADANDELNLSNLYGRITVNSWARNEVKVEVQIKGYANDDDNAQKALNRVSIEDGKDGNSINFKTHIGNNSGNGWSWTGNSKRNKVEVNYVVYMPAKIQLDVKSTYGSVILPDLSGQVKLQVAYSNVTAQRLSNPLSQISGSYGNVKAEAFNGGKISFAYGNVDLGEVNNLHASISYGSVSLGKLRGDVALSLAYLGGLKVGEIDSDLKSLRINSSYSNLILSPSARSNFNFDVSVSYAGFSFDDDRVNITHQTPEPGSRGFNPTKTYKGTFGKGNADAQVNISSAYGSVKFN
ncbi:DUF4097 family beta strand repeat-containing protein [Mucilaginibacter sp.]